VACRPPLEFGEVFLAAGGLLAASHGREHRSNAASKITAMVNLILFLHAMQVGGYDQYQKHQNGILTEEKYTVR
jgi:hypothetical protein